MRLILFPRVYFRQCYLGEQSGFLCRSRAYYHFLGSEASVTQLFRNQLYKEYDPSGLITFLLIGGMYLHIGSAVSPYLISNMDWNQCYNLSKSQNAFHDRVINESSNISQVINYMIDKYSSSFEAFRVSTCLAPEFLLGDISRLK